ncbi:MAG: thiamine pyrophosphate-binding protein [Pseudomonadota bacterium]
MSNAKRVRGTGGELLMHQLVAQGVDYAFTNTGSAEAGFFDAFLTVPGVQPILLLNESLVLSAADAYGRATRRAAFVNVHLAAGTRKGSGQLFNAHFDGTPMVVTAAMRDNGSFGDHNTLGVSSGFAQMNTVQDVTKARWEVRDAAGIPMATRRAFKEALTMPTGPVYMALSGEALDAKDVEADIEASFGVMLPDGRAHGALAEIHDALLNAKKPLLVVGPDVINAGAQQELLDLVEHFALPVAINFFDYASFPPTHPNHVGMIDGLDDRDYDVVFCLGYRPNTRADATDNRFAKAFKMGVGHDPAMLGGTFALDVELWSDVKCALIGLNTLWNPADTNLPQISARRAEVTAAGEARLAKRAEGIAKKSGHHPIHPDYLSHSMGQYLAPGSVVVSENFSTSDQHLPFGPDEDDWQLVRTYGGSLGYGLGGAVGAQLAHPDRPVVLSIGDGSVMYSAAGFWTMARYGLPIVTVVWNNMQYQTVRNNFARWGGNMAEQNRYPETFLGDPEIDFVMLAKAQGIEGMQVDEPHDLAAALTRAKDAQAAGEPYVLDVRITNVGPGADQSWYKEFRLAHT